MKRLIALFLSLTMLLSLCPINIWAEELTAKDQQVYIAEDTSADDLSGDDSAVESESQTEDAQNSTDDEVVVEDSSASAPSEEEETPSEGEDETAENGEAEFGFESITVSTPVANAAATVEARWGLARSSGNAPYSEDWEGSGTLQQAMNYANNLTSGTAYIQLRDDVNTNALGCLVFNEGTSTVLDLRGYKIDRGLTAATPNGNVITVNGTLTIRDTASGGQITGGYNSYYLGGGVHVAETGSLIMTGGTICGNRSNHGAGVFCYGTFTMTGGTISGNAPTQKAYSNSGGGVDVSGGTFTMSGGIISGNAAQFGGAVNVSSGIFTMNNGTIFGNLAYTYGGGIHLNGGTVLITGGKVEGNSAEEPYNGGGVFLEEGTFEVSGSPVIYGNVKGGTLNEVTGMYEQGVAENVFILNGPFIPNEDQAITVGVLTSGAKIGVKLNCNTGIISSGGAAYADTGYFLSDNTAYAVYADGSNLKLDTAPATVNISFHANGGNGSMSSQAVTYASATTLKANTFTRVNHVFTGWNTASDGSGTAYADGASITTTTALTLYAQWKYVEAQWGLAVNGQTPADNAWVGNGTLSEAMSYYRDIPSSDTAYIQLLNNVNTNSMGALTFASTSPAILDLNGCTIDRGLTTEQYDGYVICIGNPNYDYISSKLTICDTSTTVVANQGKITGGYCATEGGGIRVCINGSLTMNGGNITDNMARDGGGVYAYGAMVMNGGAISNNTVTWHGGGVYSYCQNGYGSFEMTGGSITNNTAKNGGGLYKNGYDFNMTGGTISNNTASERGGGVYYYGSGSGVFTMRNSTISGNTANYGGGINVVTGTLDMVSGTITKNTAVNNGGGVGVIPDYAYEAPSFVMQNGTISENTAVRGGGIHVEKGSFTMVNGTITKNTATNSGGGVSSWTNSSFTMADGTIYKNSAVNGGGVCNIGTFIMNNGSISGNNASSYGGGVYAAQGSFTMNNGMISENTATHEGGGVYVMRDTFTLNDGTISGNSAKDGGGVYLAYIDGTLLFDMKGGSIISNTATNAGGGVYPTGDSTFKISGAANISGNTVGTTENNVYLLSGQVITVGELTSDTSIGVTMLAPSTFTSGGAEYAEDDYFTSDNSVYTVAEDGENLKLVENLIGEACWGVAVGTNPPHSWVGCGTLEQATEYAAALGSSSKAYIRLLDNVETSSPLVFVAEKNAILDLNGFNIDRKLSTATENGNVITVNGNLTLCDTSDPADGKITGGNNTGFGGGVVVAGTFEMRGGAISGNKANYGGGISLVGSSNSTFTMSGGTISGNTATRGGGGVLVYLGSFVLNEGEITGNTAVDGGGVFFEYDTWSDITITGGTITGNNATSNGGGLWLDHYCLVEISGSPVISGNTKNGAASNVYLSSSTTLTVKALTSGANIGIAIEGGEGVFAKPDGTDVTSLSTYTTYFSSDNHASTVVVDGTDLKLVQNEARWGLAVDGKAPTTWVGGGTFIDAVTYANTLQSGTAYIQLLSNVNTTYGISFVSGKTTILDLNGHTIDRGLTTGSNANSEVMGGYVLNAVGNLTLCDSSSSDVSKQGKITGGKNASSYGVENRTNCGGGVHVSSSGTFTLAGGNIEGNVAKQGGGVFSLGSFTMTGGAISGNSATYRGGGVCVQEGAFTMSGGTISDNTTKEGAGVDITNGSFTLSGGFISDNTASLYGGGVQGGPFIMTGGTISGNKADQGGGGVDVTASNTFTMEGGTISDNSASWGAGVNLPANGTFIMSGGTITGNTANDHAGVNAAGSFELSGSPVIIGNTIGTGNEAIASNVYQNGDRIVVGTLTAGAAIGVSRSSGIGTFTTGGGNYAAYFTSDDPDYIVARDGNGNLMLVYPTLTGVVAEGFSGSYDGKAHGITVTAPDGATVKYGTTEGTYDKIESPTITNAGDLIVYYQVTKEGYIPATGSAKVSITKATASCTAPVAVEDLIYSGTPQTLITPAATDCGTVQYMGENGAFSSSLPTRTNAGTYYVYYKVIGDANHNDTGVLGPVEVKMDKAPLTIIAKNHTITYGDAPANNGVDYSGFVNGETASALGGTLSYSYSYEQYGNVGEYTITPAGLSSNNYEISYTKGTLTVEQKEIGIMWDNTDLTYNGKEQSPTATATGTVNGDALTLTVDGAQSSASTTGYTATVKGISGDKAGNYKLPGNVVTTFTIAKATPALGNVSVVGTVKDTTDPTDVVLTGTNTTVDGTFALTDEKLLANVTTYHWTFTPTDTANYNVVTGEVEIDVLDTVAPSVVVTVEENQWRTTLNTITFGLFFRETKTVTIEYADNENGSGIDAMLYYVSEKAVADVANIPWETYSKSFNIDPDGTFVIYAKAVDKDGNSAMVNSDGIVVDATAPLLKDIVDGGIYYGDLTITASDALAGVKTVTVDGDTVVLENGQYTIAADNSEHTVVVTDKAGNTQQYTVHVMKMYTVSFIVDGEILDTVTVGHGQSIGLPMIPDKAGYDQFPPYWNHNGKNITKDTEITAIYIINKYTVSGTVTSYLEADETVTIGLYVDDSTVAKYATVVTGNTVAYAIANVDFGTYTMKVSKENHVTREYTVVVDDHVTWNAEICPKGDVNLDGEVNADDLTALARHVAKIESLTDPYALLTANVDNNDMLSADDLTLLARFVAKIIPSL